MAPHRKIDNITVKELKTYIKGAGLTHSDCREISELRQRARMAEDNHEAEVSESWRCVPQEAVKERRKSGSSQKESELLEKAQGLLTESTKVIGSRDASEILADAEQLKKATDEHASLSPAGKKRLLDTLDEVQKNLAFESGIEKSCGRILQIGLMTMTLLPMLLTLLESLYEVATRPDMTVDSADLSNTRAVLTGGCGAMGLELAIMLANSGAGVVIGCHNAKLREIENVEARLADLGLLHDPDRAARAKKAGSGKSKGWVDAWPLQLESFASVRGFAARVEKELGPIDLLVHAAATKEGCTATMDGYEVVTQVNYLSPFLLTKLLMPKLKSVARVVHVTCDSALQQADWLPWPLSRTEARMLPRIDYDSLEFQEGKEFSPIAGCDEMVQYANSKLAVVVHSEELNRRLIDENRGVSQVVNPGAMDTEFGRSISSPEAKPSVRSSMMSYFPPVFIARKLYGFTIGRGVTALSTFMLRSTAVGAKAVYHVSTLEELGENDHGGGLFSDSAGRFTDCGKPAQECGRVQLERLPESVRDQDLASDFYERTEAVVDASSSRREEDD